MENVLKPLRVGLTGSFGSGKTAVASMFKDFGANVIDADALAYEVTAPGMPALEMIASVFGPQVLRDDGSLNRSLLAHYVFEDTIASNALKRLEAIIHPLVREKMELLYAQCHVPVVIFEIPLLFEVGLHLEMDKVIVVRIDEHHRFGRLHARGYHEREIMLRLRYQIAQASKIKYADAIIHNSGSLEETRRQVRDLWNQMQQGMWSKS